MPATGLDPSGGAGDHFPSSGPRRLEVRRAELVPLSLYPEPAKEPRLFGDVAVETIRFIAPTTFSAGEQALDVLVVTSGAIDAINQSAVHCEQEQVLIVSPQRSCRLTTSAKLEAVRYRIRGSFQARLREHAPVVPYVFDPIRCVDIIARLASELRRADAATGLAIEAALCELIARAARLSTTQPSLSIELAAAIHYVRTHIGERITVAGMAGAAGVSSRVITSRFAVELMTSPLDYVRSLRLAEAAVCVVAGTESLAGIAHRLGFYDHAHFTKLFREAYGVPPSEYRRGASSPPSRWQDAEWE